MLPSVLAGQLQQGLEDYIRTTFPMTTPGFKGSIDRMLETENSVFHEPYAAVRLPFRVAEDKHDMFTAIHMQFNPYVHQQIAFERLTGEDGRSTLIATGTGSGKTECFLYPILEYCYRHRGETGIKALIIYPMNALAFDQSKRIAELIYNSPELKGKVTAGMYVGGYEAAPSRMMNEFQIITDHETMLSSPPDILLTNYKMLDYLLVRPKDAVIWQENKPETLKYIVVDELHTFDGAQGTDLACLLRRMKARLFTPNGYLCCIGTSATMGAKENADSIREYASDVFGEPFENDAVITEDRLSSEEFLAGSEITDFTIPTQAQVDQLVYCVKNDEPLEYLKKAADSWFNDTFVIDDIMSDNVRLNIGQRLMEHSFTHLMLSSMESKYVQPSHICEELKSKYPQLNKLSKPTVALDALFALISHARLGSPDKLRPFLTVQVQIWMRELRRLLAKVSPDDITYALASDLNEQQARQYLPVINCRDCGATGWVSLANERGNLTITDLGTFYNLFFKQDEKIFMFFPDGHQEKPYYMLEANVCSSCLQLHPKTNSDSYCCGEDTFPIIYPAKIPTVGAKENKQYVCPFCSSSRGLAIMGLRSATAISATVSQMFASKFNDDKKTLAFSDNVQDAAHRAGFFNSRTWKFGLRSAIQRFALVEGHGLSLEEFSSQFIDYWHRNLSKEDFTGLFIAPNMTWMREFEKLKAEKKFGSGLAAKKLMADIERRLKYEIMLEFGLTSRIGRTLEKSGCSAIGFDRQKVTDIAATIKERTINELGALQQTSDIAFKRMVLGFLNILRSNGAFNDAAFNVYTNNSGKSYLLSNHKEKWLPGLQTGRNTPRFIYMPNAKGRRLYSFDLPISPKYFNWVAACVDEFILGEEIFNEVCKIILSELVESEMLVSMPAPAGYTVWGIDKQKTIISTNVIQLACDVCGTMVSAIEENEDVWQGAPCTGNKCGGYLRRSGEASLGYYGKLYSSGDLIRIVATEHTGIVERDEREKLERDFKRSRSEQMPWDTNLLSCTPTLEMGIDIGDLSTVILCNIPPIQSQYLQRTGRAGRKDGNALTVAVANARPHDLYFYAEPMEMLSGAIEPPRVFLNASAVLERQFVAYSMDCWIKRGIKDSAIPKNIGICLNNLNKKSTDMFPFNFLNYVQNNLSSLLRTFIHMFAQHLDDATISELNHFAQGDKLYESPMHMKVLEAFENLKKHRDAISENVKQLKSLIKEIESKPRDISHDEQIKELKRERMALVNVIRSLSHKNVFNFLSDEGLLPNYAFPEAGIILKAILFRKAERETETPADNRKRKYEKMFFEYSRSASSAISEFAPDNNFYVDGRKLTINQIDLTTTQTAKWRLCPNCSHAQLEDSSKSITACPQCGSPSWADTGQVRTMLKVQMVYSNMDYTKSLISDESDDRSSKFYCKQMLVDVDEENDIHSAYRMDNDEFAFGYEFVKKAVLREINFGEKDIFGERLTISGVEEVRKGFKICKHCGKLQPEHGEPEHTYTCKTRTSNLLNGESFEEFLFLYREFATEALRILVPATTLDSTQMRKESFTAAFMLGMQEYFGNVDHLRACFSEVPVVDADYRKQYLVIYDSVPGGTGYLKQLMQQDSAVIEIFERALFVMEDCNCKNDPQKDGCYRCLYAYRQSNNIGQISRVRAIKLLKAILSGKDKIEKIPKLGNIPVNSLFESELEARFIAALGQMSSNSRNITITKQLVNNKEGYLLKVGQCLWEIEPQVVLDNYYGVSVQSRADFIIWPVRPSSGRKPIAVFTDGFLYHKDKVDDDTLKREAIRRSNRFRVWSLSWKDIQSVFQAQGEYAAYTLVPNNMPSGINIYKPVVENGNAQKIHPDKATPMELLMNYLENVEAEELFAVHAKAFAMSLLDAKNLGNVDAFKEWSYLIEPIIDALALRDEQFDLNDAVFGKWAPSSTGFLLTILAGVTASEFKMNKINADISVCALLNDEIENRTDKYEYEWNGFWHFFNVMQFLPGFAAVSVNGLNKYIYNSIPVKWHDVGLPAREGASEDLWDETIAQLFNTEAKEWAEKLIALKIPSPSAVGFELTDSHGEVIAECEMAWEDKKIALLIGEQSENAEKFREREWQVIIAEDDFLIEDFQRGIET